MTPESQTPRYFLPFLGPLYARFQSWAYPMLRITVGLWFMPHGYMKLIEGTYTRTAFGMALNLGGHPRAEAAKFAASWEPVALYIGALELVGGALLALGFLTRIWAAQFAGFMVVAWFFVAWPNWFWPNRGGEVPVLLLLLSIIILIRGGGAFSIDRKIGREF